MVKAERIRSGFYPTYPDVLPKDFLCDELPALLKVRSEGFTQKPIRVLSLFSGCGGMDLGFEGRFIANRKSFARDDDRVALDINHDWVLLKKNRFQTVFANDIFPKAEVAWTNYMSRFGYAPSLFHCESVVDLVKRHHTGVPVFPQDVDVVLGGFPCQDFSLAGKRLGFKSYKDHKGERLTDEKASEETRGKLYFWMKQVVEITRPKIFVAENVRGLVNLGNVKDIIQRDFASADGNGYLVLPPQILHAGNYGVPETRERVIFIGIRRDALLATALRALESDTIPKAYNPYPKPTHAATLCRKGLLPPVTTYDVLKDVQEPETSVDYSQKIYSGAKFMDNGTQGQIEIRLDGLAPTIRSEHHGNIEFRRLSAEHGGKHAEELSAGLRERRLTPRECALIQTFPPDYKFVVRIANTRSYQLSSSDAYRIIGNAVPPVLAYHIATRLQELWPLYFGASQQ